MKRFFAAGGAALAALCLPFSAGAQSQGLLQEKCAACHALGAPDYKSAGLKERIERKGPPLFYAGNKFRAEWLVQWLQKPERIRPAGVFPPAHVKAGPKGDVVDEASLPAHPALGAAEAQSVAAQLMTLKPFDSLVQAATYEPGSVNPRLGQMDFGKFKGCDGCHQDAPGRGGISGPELYTAWQRLQPKFIAAFIAAPNAWDPHAMMPAPELQPEAVHKLANYLKLIGEKKP